MPKPDKIPAPQGDPQKAEKASLPSKTAEQSRLQSPRESSEPSKEKLRIPYPVIVEGKYDKITLSSVMEGLILQTDGFALFRRSDRQALLRRIAAAGDILVLCDSDGGGRQIRRYLSSILPPEHVHHLFIPQVAGKERRKKAAGAAGTLGVEGMDRETLRRLLAPFALPRSDADPTRPRGRAVTKADFYDDRLSGAPDAAARRAALALAYRFPPDMTANALLDAINLLSDYDEYRRLLDREN